jgi:leucyl aminopeptidase (aminopeptidase T)
MNEAKMKEGALNALDTILEVGKGKTVLVVTDPKKLGIGKAFEAAARELGAATEMYILPARRPMKALPEDLLPKVEGFRPMAADTVFINAFSGMAEETPLRIQLIRMEEDVGGRVGHAPGITEEMMTEGPMNVDYREIAINARALMARFKGAEKAHLTAPSGTDIIMGIGGRDFETDVEIKNGAMGNLPAGEIWCAPVEDSAQGVIVADGSIGDLGAIKKPLTIVVKGGKVQDVKGGTPALLGKLDKFLKVDEMATVIGELGIGLNPGARITGNLLEDEKAGGTAHIAFGNNTDMPGGKNTSKTHRDFLFHRPTLTVTFSDGRQETILKDGKPTNEG